MLDYNDKQLLSIIRMEGKRAREFAQSGHALPSDVKTQDEVIVNLIRSAAREAVERECRKSK